MERLPPPLSPAITMRAGSMFSAAALASVQWKPETQSLSPAGNGATSGADEGRSALRKSTITTATPWAAMIRPQAW